jgi:hypothetical protein
MGLLLLAVLAAAFALGSAELRADDKTAPIGVPAENARDMPGKTPEQRRAWWLQHTGDFGRGRGEQPAKGRPKASRNTDAKEKAPRELQNTPKGQ